LPEPSDEDLKNVDLRNISDTENSTATENENLKAEIKKHLKDTSLLDDWKIFQNESDTKDKCVIEFENEKLQTFTGKTFEKRENFEKDVADFLAKLIDFHTKPTALKSNENIKVGDIAYSDGSVSAEYDNTKIPVGIVIEVTNGRATKIVSLKETTAGWGTAKNWCNTYTDASGSRDWHLPTKEELNQLYKAKDEVNVAIKKIIIGEGARKKRNDWQLLLSLNDLLKEDIVKKIGSDVYWSTKYSGNYAWIQRFSDGYQGNLSKSLSNSVRAVRDF
jgi:5'-deoxynucleotidase YfbR-like HD superfamily hydrolase